MTEQKMSSDAQEKLQQLQMIEQSLQASLSQKQSFQVQQVEIKSALEALSGKQRAYKIIGNILVDTSAESLRKELEEKNEIVQIRLRALDKQEEKIKEKSKVLQSEVLRAMKK